MSFRPASFIAHKRDGGEHSPDELQQSIDEFLAGTFSDYQMTAWLMAVYLRGLSDSEMTALTRAMLMSGSVSKRGDEGPPRIDKHSTGGVGDKISIPLAPLVAACGVRVPMIAGRGLGHTGGTLDKLESIPGYSTTLKGARFERIVARVGASIIGQSEELAPADRRIYALRDVTGTVACRPLIVASILSKKLAEGLDGLVMDVKVGRGAFMTDLRQARALARSLVHVAQSLGTPTVARLTQMNVPLGRTIGNALEIRESIEVLRGEGPADVVALTLTLATDMLLLAGVAKKRSDGLKIASGALEDGRALSVFQQMVEAQGGDPRVIDKPTLLPRTKLRVILKSSRNGYLQDLNPLALSEVALELGAGRKRTHDKIDPAVGIELHARVGEKISRGQPLATLHLRKKNQKLAGKALDAFDIGSRRSLPPQLLLSRPIRQPSDR